MITVYKYEFEIVDSVSFEMPEGAKPIYVDMQRLGTPAIWCQVDDSKGPEERKFRVVGTGNELCPPEDIGNFVYVGSFQQLLPFATFIWHVYEDLTPTEQTKEEEGGPAE